MNRKQRRQEKKPAPSSPPVHDGPALFAQAAGHYQAGRLAEAERLFRQVLAMDPRHAESLNILALIYAQVGRNDIAAELMAQAVQVADIAPYHNNLGTFLLRLGHRDRAIVHYERAIALKPDYADGHYNLANVLKDAGRLQDAIAHYRKAVGLRPDYVDAHVNMGNAYKLSGKLDEAQSQYRQALTIAPNCALASNNLGVILQDKEEFAAAVDLYRQALAVAPDYVEARHNLGVALKNMGRLDEAIAELRQVLALQPDYADAHYTLGVSLYEKGERGTAAPCLKRYLEHCPHDPKGANLLLAALGQGELPQRASDAMLQKLYATRAYFWAQDVRTSESYRGHTLVADMYRRHCGLGKATILDAGCGTGMVGQLIRDCAGRLEGIDLSAPMLEGARAKGIYDQLHHGDLLAFLNQSRGAYGAITCAATLIHFGDLQPVFAAAAAALSEGGLFVFTLFPNESDAGGFAVAQSQGMIEGGCYMHGRDYVCKIACANGFVVEEVATDVHEYHKGMPVNGLVVALRRAGGT